ncbi:hypothetical protein Tcan_08212 [Toxocara canis]|uniref:Uncharacterized protein n=1 Tax=Toxocara canis TaxID=6265 RepID=A0A0B2VJR2_TOXCA|nr:hypothetical protein Tcan_08212 [Toxocara canis]
MADCLLFNTIIRSVRANRARARRSPVGADIDGDQFVATTTTQPGPSYPKQQKVDRATGGPVAFPDIASYECACRDVVSIKNQLLELQRIINNSAAADQLRDAAAEQPNGISVERLLRENDALRKELAEKDHIINTLRAQMTLN